MNGMIDYSNLQNITKKLKQDITDKYKTFEKITSEIQSSSGAQSGSSGGGGGGLGELGDLLDIFFTQNTYNGTLKINGGLVVDFIESAEGAQAATTDTVTVNKLISKAIRNNNKKFSAGGIAGSAGSVSSLSGASISSSSIRNSFFSGGTIAGATVESLEGLDNLFKDDYLDMYSISSVRDNFTFYVSSAYNDIRFTYDDKDTDYYTLSFGQEKDIFTNQNWVLSNQNINNSYINSKVYNVQFQPGNLPIGITGLTQSNVTQRAKFKISDMNVEIGQSNSGTAAPITTINGDLKVMNGGRILLDTREIKPTGGSGAAFIVPVDGITNTGAITKINVLNGGSGYDPGSSNIIFGAPRFGTREVFNSEGNQSGPVATVVVDDASGVITSITLDGVNSTVYPGAPDITISSTNGGTGASARAVMLSTLSDDPSNATISSVNVISGGTGYTQATTTVTIANSPSVVIATLELGSLVITNGVIISVSIPEGGIGSFYMRQTATVTETSPSNTIIMNTSDVTTSKTFDDLFTQSISLTNDALTDLQIKFVNDSLNQTSLSSVPSGNKNTYDNLNINSGFKMASKIVLIQGLKFKIKTLDNKLTHIGPFTETDTVITSDYDIPVAESDTLKNWFIGMQLFQGSIGGNIVKIALTELTSETPAVSLGAAADGDAIGTFNGQIRIDLIISETMTDAEESLGFISQFTQGTDLSGEVVSGSPIYIGGTDAAEYNARLPTNTSGNPKPIEYLSTYNLYNSSTGRLDFITDGSTSIVSGSNTFIAGTNNKLIIGYDSSNMPTVTNNELVHVNGIIKADSIENTQIGIVTPSSGNFTSLIVNNNATITGNLTVTGTQTTINSTTLTVDDINIEMGSVDSPSDITAAGGGIILKGLTDKSILWNSENWTSSENFNLDTTKEYKINNISVLSESTLGNNIVSSSLTSVGLLGSGSIGNGFGNIDNGGSNITTGGLFKIDTNADVNDRTGDSISGRICLGESEELNIYHGGTDSFIINTTGDLILQTKEASKGFILDAKNGSLIIQEDGNTITTIDNTGINLSTGDEFKINNISVLSETTLGNNIVASSLTSVGILDSGTISSGFGNIDNGVSNITTGGLFKIDTNADVNDKTGDSISGRICLGESEELNIYHGGTDSFIINTTGDLILQTKEASKGFILDAKNGSLIIQEDGNTITTIDNTGINLSTGDELKINNISVLSETTLGNNIVASSLTSVGILDSGTISSGFGNIDNGGSNITTGGLFKIDTDADENDNSADSLLGRLTLGANEDLNIYHGGTDSFIINTTGDLILQTKEASKGFILDAKNGSVVIQEDGNTITTIDNNGINLSTGDELKINNISVLSETTLGNNIVASSLTSVGILETGAISSGFGNIDNGGSNITTGGLFKIDTNADTNDNSADSLLGRLTLGANEDLNIYHGGTDSFIINTTGDLILQTKEASKGFILDAKNGSLIIQENGNTITTIDTTGINLSTGDELKINNVSVLSETTLGNNIVTSSLTSVGILDSGTISSGFGNIDIGGSNITTGGLFKIDTNADANDNSADSLSGRLTLGANEDLNIYHGGTDSFIINTTGDLILQTKEASTGFILDAKNGSLIIQEDGNTITTIDNNGINLSTGDELKINSISVLSETDLGAGIINSSLTNVGVLSGGSISTDFGDIDNGTNSIKSGKLETGSIIIENSVIGITSNATLMQLSTNKLTINAVLDASQIEATLVTSNLTGDVTGDLTGDVTGDLTGDVTGNVNGNLVGNVTGDIVGDLSGDVTGNLVGNVNGNLTGDVTGNLTGDVTGNLVGDVTGNLTGDVTGDVTGNLTGDVTGDVTGNLTGDVTGDVTGNLTGELTGNVVGDVTGNITGDLTGNVIGDVLGNITGELKGGVKDSINDNEWIGKPIVNSKLAVSEAIQNIAVMDLPNEANEGSQISADTNLELTNKLIKAEENINNLRNTVESLLLAMNQLLNSFE